MKLKVAILAIVMLNANWLSAQELLKKEDAIAIALEHNFDIREAGNNKHIARNNTDIKNSGYLPSLSASGSTNFSTTNSENVTNAGEVLAVSGVQTERYSASVGLNYVVYNGQTRKYNFKKLQENLNLSELQARAIIENVILDIFDVYYEVARLTQNELNQKESLDISRKRWRRAKYSFDYGQNTQLDVLNAEVDYNNDSINYLNIRQQLANEKRNLNLLLGRDVNIAFDVDTSLTYQEGLSLESVLQNSLAGNVNILQQQGNYRSAEYDVKISNGSNLPTIGLTSSYGWNQNNLGKTSFFDSQNQKSFNYGATLSWDIFDGGQTSIRKQNSRIMLENQRIGMDRLKLNLNRDVNNAWSIYETARFILKVEEKNLATNERNFDRTSEQQALGQVTSIEFRQAQLNLLNAKLNYNQARFNAKNAELDLLQLSGDLMEAEY